MSYITARPEKVEIKSPWLGLLLYQRLELA